MKILFPISALLTLGLLGCNPNSSESSSDTVSEVTDSVVDFDFSPSEDLVDERDGRVYKTVRIGSQVWMRENLKFDAGEGSYCYDDVEQNCEERGRLYTWKTAMGGAETQGAQGVCPNGWHIPSDNDWNILIETVGGETAGDLFKEGGMLGFNGDLTGGRMALGEDDYKYIKEGTDVCFWSSESDSTGAYDRNLNNMDDKIAKRKYPKNYGFCVRCIKDEQL